MTGKLEGEQKSKVLKGATLRPVLFISEDGHKRNERRIHTKHL